MNFKKISFACLCFFMLLMACAQTVAAKAADTVSVDGVQYSAAVNQSGSGWSWNAQDKKLTLSGYDGGRISGGVAPFNVEIAAGSTNRITVPDGKALSASGTFNLTGTGSLTIGVADSATQKADYGVFTSYYLTINGPTLNISNCDIGVYGYYTCKLTNAALTCSNVTEAIYTSSSSGMVFNGGSVTIDGAEKALHAWEGFDVTGTSFHIKNAAVAFSSVHSSSDYVSTSMTLRNANVTIENCTKGFEIISGYYVTDIFTATGSDITIRNVSSYGIRSNSANLSGVKLRVTGSGGGIGVARKLIIAGGCDLYVRSTDHAIYAASITISNTDKLDLASGTAPLQGPAELNGKSITYTGNRILIENGAIVEQGDQMVNLRVGDVMIEADALESPAGGAGWTWSGAGRELTLNGYNGGAISAAGGTMTVTVSNDSTITGTLKL
ncbi:MAG: hypothetical protein GX592_05220, partial [Clostridiales bacterium]|nr:hypothetical protein [Clostridiales bacterium]